MRHPPSSPTLITPPMSHVPCPMSLYPPPRHALQIRELTRQLDKEKHRKKEQARSASETGRRLIVCSQLLPYKVKKEEDGSFTVGDASAKLHS